MFIYFVIVLILYKIYIKSKSKIYQSSIYQIHTYKLILKEILCPIEIKYMKCAVCFIELYAQIPAGKLLITML